MTESPQTPDTTQVQSDPLLNQPETTIEVDGTVTTESTEGAQNAERVYLSVTFNNVSRETAGDIVEAARAAAGQTSFSVYYSEADENSE